MAALASALFRSPDLTFDQAMALRADYIAMLTAMHAETKKLETLAGSTREHERFAGVGDILRMI